MMPFGRRGYEMGLPCKMPSGTLVSLRRKWGSWTRLRINQGRAGRLPISQAGAVRGEEGDPDKPPRPEQGGGYSIEQAISDRAQLHTLAFDGLAFLTGDFGSSTFLSPGKVADFSGFQYMRNMEPPPAGP